MDILRTTEKMISEVQFVVRLESLRNLVILGRRLDIYPLTPYIPYTP